MAARSPATDGSRTIALPKVSAALLAHSHLLGHPPRGSHAAFIAQPDVAAGLIRKAIQAT